MLTLRAKFDGNVLIPTEPVDLVVGQEVELQVMPPRPPGSIDALLAAMRRPPHIPAEDVDELERMIEEGKQPASYKGVFDDLGEG